MRPIYYQAKKLVDYTVVHLVPTALVNSIGARGIKEKLQLADVIVSPDFGFTQISFKDAKLYITAGEIVTKEAIIFIAKSQDKSNPQELKWIAFHYLFSYRIQVT